MVQFDLLKWLLFYKKINYFSYYAFFKKCNFFIMSNFFLHNNGSQFLFFTIYYKMESKLNKINLFYFFKTSRVFFLKKISKSFFLKKNKITLITAF